MSVPRLDLFKKNGIHNGLQGEIPIFLVVPGFRQRASRTIFTTLKGAVDANMDYLHVMRNKGQAARESVRVWHRN